MCSGAGGLSHRLYHRWDRYDAFRGWVTVSRMGFGISGGRNGGFRGYTYKQEMAPGQWRGHVGNEKRHTGVFPGLSVETHKPADPGPGDGAGLVKAENPGTPVTNAAAS